MENPPASTAWLESADGATFPLSGNCSLGRSSGCHVVIGSVKASRHHATIHVQDAAEFWLIDLGSSNGTLLNDRRVARPVRLHDGDRISIAETGFLFRQATAASEDPSTIALPTMVNVRSEERWLLLADLEGFTPLSQRLAPEELATLVGAWVRSGREIVEGHGGTLNKYLGDGYLACWPGGAASSAQVAAAVLAFHAQWSTAEPKFRIIVHHGTISVGGSAAASFGEESLMGPELNFTFRVEKVAGSVGAAFCFTAAAHAALGEGLALVPIPGDFELKGFPGRYEFYRL